MRFESWGKFQNESISKRARAFLSQRPGLNQRPHALQVASLPHELSWFNVDRLKIGLFVCRYIASFQSLMDVQPLWHVDVYQQNMFRRGRNEAKNHILNQNLFSFVSMRIKKKSNFLSADQTSVPGVDQVFPVFEWNLIVVLLSKILDRLKRLFVVQIPRVTVYREMRNIYV